MAISKIILNKTTQIDVTQDTVAVGSMLSGITAHKNDGTQVTGNIASKTSNDVTTSNNVVTIPVGYYGSQVQKTVGTAQAAQTITPTTSDQTIASGKYLTGTQTIKGDANLIADNIAKDVTIFGITGTHEGGADISDTTATASDVLTGKYFYTSEGVKTQGTIQSQSAQTITPTTTDQTIASGTYLSGTQTIKGDANLVASSIALGTTLFGVEGTFDGQFPAAEGGSF